jgi:hypothetical protein
MKIIAKQGEERFLLQINKQKGRIIDLEQKKVFPENNIQSILLRGYWEEYELTEEETMKLLEKNNLKL